MELTLEAPTCNWVGFIFIFFVYSEFALALVVRGPRPYLFIDTDRSKSDYGVGAAAMWGDAARMATLPREASIFTAETHAIYLAKNVILENPSTNFVILPDSLGTLQRK